MLLTEDEVELYQNQRNLALSTIDDLTDLKIQLLESGIPIPLICREIFLFPSRCLLIYLPVLVKWG